MSKFWLKPGHCCILLRLWILLKPSVSGGFLWHCSTSGGGRGALLHPCRVKAPRSASVDTWLEERRLLLLLGRDESSQPHMVSTDVTLGVVSPVLDDGEDPDPSLCARVLCFSFVQHRETLRTVACQAPLSMGFSRQEHWSGFSYPPPGDLPNPRIKSTSLMSPTLADTLPLTPRGKPRPFLRPPLLALEIGEGGTPQHIQVVAEVRAPLLIPQERGTS